MVEAKLGVAVVLGSAAPKADDPLLTTRRLVKFDVSRTILRFRRRDRSFLPAASAVWAALVHLYAHATTKR